MCEITTALKKRFCNDNNISMQLFSEPYFEDRLSLFGKEISWNLFVDMLKKYKTEEDFFAEYNKLKDDAIQFIKSSEAFNSLNTEPSSFFEVKQYNLPDRDTYKEMNVGRKFFSIDMVKANFTCLVYYSKKKAEQFFDSYSYDDFLRQFTENDYFIRSKYIRQVIFGNCNCKRMIAYEKVMMAELLDILLSSHIVDLKDIYSLRADEIIIDVTDFTDEQIHIIEDFLLEITEEGRLSFPTDFETYVVHKFKNEDAYVRMFENNIYDIKKVDVEDAPAVYRKMKGLPDSDLDLYFFHNGRVARFEEQKEWILE